MDTEPRLGNNGFPVNVNKQAHANSYNDARQCSISL